MEQVKRRVGWMKRASGMEESWNRRKIWFLVLLEAILFLFALYKYRSFALLDGILVSCMACFVIDFYLSLFLSMCDFVSVFKSSVLNSNQMEENLLGFYHLNASHVKRLILFKAVLRHRHTLQSAPCNFCYFILLRVCVRMCICCGASGFNISLCCRQ